MSFKEHHLISELRIALVRVLDLPASVKALADLTYMVDTTYLSRPILSTHGPKSLTVVTSRSLRASTQAIFSDQITD